MQIIVERFSMFLCFSIHGFQKYSKLQIRKCPNVHVALSILWILFKWIMKLFLLVIDRMQQLARLEIRFQRTDITATAAPFFEIKYWVFALIKTLTMIINFIFEIHSWIYNKVDFDRRRHRLCQYRLWAIIIYDYFLFTNIITTHHTLAYSFRFLLWNHFSSSFFYLSICHNSVASNAFWLRTGFIYLISI